MADSLMRHARGLPGYSDLAEKTDAALGAVRYAVASRTGAVEMAVIAAHLGEIRLELAKLAGSELAVEAIWNDGYETACRDERAVIESSRKGRYPASRPRGHLRAVKLISAAFIGGFGLIRYASRTARTHAALTALAVSALGGAAGVYTLSPYQQVPQVMKPAPAALVPTATAPAPAALVTLAPRRRKRGHHHRQVTPRPVPVTTGRPPHPSPSPSATPSPSASAAPGTVTAPPVILAGGTGQLILTASGGPVAWSLTCTPGLTLSAYSGHLADGQTVTITVTSASPAQGGTIWLQPDGTAVQVRTPAFNPSSTRSAP